MLYDINYSGQRNADLEAGGVLVGEKVGFEFEVSTISTKDEG